MKMVCSSRRRKSPRHEIYRRSRRRSCPAVSHIRKRLCVSQATREIDPSLTTKSAYNGFCIARLLSARRHSVERSCGVYVRMRRRLGGVPKRSWPPTAPGHPEWPGRFGQCFSEMSLPEKGVLRRPPCCSGGGAAAIKTPRRNLHKLMTGILVWDSMRQFVPNLYENSILWLFSVFYFFLKSATYEFSAGCWVSGSNPCRGATVPLP
jgi:hypothetical protein